VSHGRDRGRREPEPLLARELHLAELVADHQPIDWRQAEARRQRLDVQPVAGIGRDATGAGMRVGQIAGVLELGQNVAHGRRRHAEAIAVDQGLAADRLGGGHVFVNDGPQDRL
jgi:hypothetical protein